MNAYVCDEYQPAVLTKFGSVSVYVLKFGVIDFQHVLTDTVI